MEGAWATVHHALPAGWSGNRPTWHIEDDLWHVVAAAATSVLLIAACLPPSTAVRFGTSFDPETFVLRDDASTFTTEQRPVIAVAALPPWKGTPTWQLYHADGRLIRDGGEVFAHRDNVVAARIFTHSQDTFRLVWLDRVLVRGVGGFFEQQDTVLAEGTFTVQAVSRSIRLTSP